MIRKFRDLPDYMKNDEVRPYYRIVAGKKVYMFFKRLMDIVLSALALILVSPIILITAIIIKLGSKGPLFYRQTRVTRYGREFKILKFRTMVVDADKIGGSVTVDNDPRVTGIGRLLRRFRLDEFPQLINVLIGDMSLIGTRPEVPAMVAKYDKVMYATLLTRSGMLSSAAIEFKHEADLLKEVEDTETYYIKEILPKKMEYNLSDIEHFSFINEVKIFFRALGAIFDL